MIIPMTSSYRFERRTTNKMKKGIKTITAMLLAATLTVSLAGCGGSSDETSAPEETTVDYNSMSLEDLEAQAKEEGEVASVGMPDTWANWIETWTEITDTYGIEHTDLDMSSSEEIAMFKEEGEKGTKDIGDVGQQWGPVAEEEGVTLKYKTSYWDSIPDWAKDDDGDWVSGYYGTISIITNDEQIPEAPTSFADILEGDYKVTIGDVSAAAQAQHAVLAIAYAMGGSIDDMQPAYDFLSQLAEEGRLDIGDTSVARIESGETIALVSDAGTPGISDPGFLLVRTCIAHGVEVETLPGATAFVPALIQSGFPADRFCFEGFLPQKKGRNKRLEQLQEETRTIIFYESPYRVVKTLEQLAVLFGPERPVSVSRELTKKFEETVRGRLDEVAAHFREHEPKGEFVIVLAGRQATRAAEDEGIDDK